MAGYDNLSKGYCQAYGGEALFGATASHCREINRCTAPDCPLEKDGRRPDLETAERFLVGPFSLMGLARGQVRRR